MTSIIPSHDKHALPSRTGTVMSKASVNTGGYSSEDEAILDEDNSEVTKLFAERLRGWKHACAYLEEYIHATEKLHSGVGKDYHHVLKTVSHPLKEGNHFNQENGGIAGLFDNIRTNTQAISHAHSETAKALKGSVLPIFHRLHQEIKHKTKELIKGAGKGSKAVEKTKNATLKHIELLGQHLAAFDSTGGKLTPENDPYVLKRGIMHRLNKQILEENANRHDLLAVQDNFASFEVHILHAFQEGLAQFHSVVAKQDEKSKSLYGDMVATAQRIPGDFEWRGFIKRYNTVLLDPHAPERNINHIAFPSQHHRATTPLISGSLDRRSKILKRYETAYYVVTASKYLHEFKTDDDFGKDPVPENSLFLPDCVVGALDGTKFIVKGKDVSKGKLGINLSTNHDYTFKAHSAQDAVGWWEVIRQAAGQVTSERPDATAPNSPVSGKTDEEKFGSLATTAAAAPALAHHEKQSSLGGQETGVAVTDTALSHQAPATTHVIPEHMTHAVDTHAVPAVGHKA